MTKVIMKDTAIRNTESEGCSTTTSAPVNCQTPPASPETPSSDETIFKTAKPRSRCTAASADESRTRSDDGRVTQLAATNADVVDNTNNICHNKNAKISADDGKHLVRPPLPPHPAQQQVKVHHTMTNLVRQLYGDQLPTVRRVPNSFVPAGVLVRRDAAAARRRLLGSPLICDPAASRNFPTTNAAVLTLSNMCRSTHDNSTDGAPDSSSRAVTTSSGGCGENLVAHQVSSLVDTTQQPAQFGVKVFVDRLERSTSVLLQDDSSGSAARSRPPDHQARTALEQVLRLSADGCFRSSDPIPCVPADRVEEYLQRYHGTLNGLVQ